MELYLLEYLVAFYQMETVEAASQKLHVTAPTVSRGLKKLEKTMEIELFDRQPKKISLNETGIYAAKEAMELLKEVDIYQEKVTGFYRQHDELSIASTLPGILKFLKEYPEELNLFDTPISEDRAEAELVNRNFQMIITTKEYSDADFESIFLGRDQLEIKITKYNHLYEKDNVSFKDLAGHEFVLSRQIGVWKSIIEKMAPDSMLIYQDTQKGLDELIRYSNFPIFSSRINDKVTQEKDDKRKVIPVSDKEATIELYATYLKENRRHLRPLVQYLSKKV